MSNWDRVKSYLVAQGHMTADGVTRRVTARTCRTCHAPILAGLTGLRCARDARVDPDPLSPLGEALAVLGGRATFALWRAAAGRYELENRDQFSIAGTPAGTSTRYDVLAEHVCNAAPLPAAESVFPPPATTATSSRPPF